MLPNLICIHKIFIRHNAKFYRYYQISLLLIFKGRNYLSNVSLPKEKHVVAVINPPLPRDGGTARTAIQVHAVNLIEIRLGERWQPISN